MNPRRRALTGSIAAALIVVTASGCALGAQNRTAPPEQPETAHPIIRVSPQPTEPILAAYHPDADDFRCVPPIPAVAEFQRSMVITPDQASWVPPTSVMVEVGPGNNPDEIWWIVAWNDETLGRWWPQNGPTPGALGRSDRVYLTNAPSATQPSGERWIIVSHHINLTEPDGWGLVQWPAERLAKAQRAEAYALACLE